MNLKQKVAIVTGSTRGIGKAIAIRLAQLGAQVVICGTQEHKTKAVAEEISKNGAEAIGIGVDVSDGDSVEAMIKGTVAAFGGIQILVNNAGVTRDGLLLRMKESDWDVVMNVNLKGAFLCTKYAMRYIMKGYGRIINISSIAGLVGNPGQANYAASKAGLIAFTKTLAKEFAKKKITANAVAPGYIQTDMTEGISPDKKASITAGIPLNSLGTPEQVANAVAFFASPDAAYITGQVLSVDGGLAI